MKLAAVSVDLDEISQYHAIHGLPSPDNAIRQAIHQKALPRLGRLFAEKGVQATFFVIGAEIGVSAETDERLKGLRKAGHEIANHTLSHPYNLTRLPFDEMRREVEEGAGRIASLVGRKPIGFRAPGYTVTDEFLDLLRDQGYRYDSSVFPCPFYYSAKAAVMAGMRIRGRKSRSILDRPSVLLASTDPYRIGRPYWKKGNGMAELPIGVSGPLRLPFIGTSVLLSGEWLFDFLATAMMERPFVNLELHGMDLADAETDGLTHLAKHQPDLRLPLEHKERRLAALFDRLKERGFEFVTLADAAERLLPDTSGSPS